MDILVLDMLDLDIEVSMVMESVRLRLSPRLLLTPMCCMEDMEDMDLDMDLDMEDIPVLDILVFMDGIVKKYLKSRTPIHT